MNGFTEYDFTTPQYGVYILVLEREIVYIGKSTYVYNRVNTHYRSRKIRFNRCFIKLCANLKEMDGLEYQLISKYKPKHNRKDLGYSDIRIEVDISQIIGKSIDDYVP